MPKVMVYPSKRHSIANDRAEPGPKLCTSKYYELHNEQEPDYSRGVQVDPSVLDGDECVLASKLPNRRGD
jgi:hypothetical protein